MPYLTRFLILGPPVGTLGYIVTDQVLAVSGKYTSFLAQPIHPVDPWGALITIPALWLYGLVLAYPLGLLPAGVSAVLFKYLVSKQAGAHRSVRAALGCITGMTAAALFGFALNPAISDPWRLLPWAVAGAFGGGASGIGAVSPNANAV